MPDILHHIVLSYRSRSGGGGGGGGGTRHRCHGCSDSGGSRLHLASSNDLNIISSVLSDEFTKSTENSVVETQNTNFFPSEQYTRYFTFLILNIQ